MFINDCDFLWLDYDYNDFFKGLILLKFGSLYFFSNIELGRIPFELFILNSDEGIFTYELDIVFWSFVGEFGVF